MKTASARYRKLNEVLGEGSYKTVTKAIDEEEGKEVAYNEVKIKRYEEENQLSSSFSKEIALLKNIDHPYILKIFDYWFTEEEFVFITELMTGGTLRDYIIKVGPLNSKLIKKWGRQVLEGLRYLHTQDPPIIHRDIKNENIFVNASQGEIKIGDLGIAKEKKYKRYTIVGTPNFMAREIFEGEGYSEKVDIYAFGMCLLEMATGKTPYSEHADSSEVYRSVLRGILPASLGNVQDGCLRSLIMACLVPCANRYSAAQCLEHHFFQISNSCKGDCLPKHCATVFPLCESNRGMELSLISFSQDVMTFQILLTDSSRFIKFDYDLGADTLEKIAAELAAENIIDRESIESFIELLDKGIHRAVKKREEGILRTGTFDQRNEDPGNGVEVVLQSSESMRKIEFGEKTLEMMKEIEEEMLLVEQRKAEAEIGQKKGDPGAAIGAVISNALAPGLPVETSSAGRKSARTPSPQNNSHTDTSGSAGSMGSGRQGADGSPAEELSLSEGYEVSKEKYKTNCSVAQFVYDAATLTGRSEDTAKSWIKALREEDIETVFDLKLMAYEDWERLPLTVFSSRIMQNMLYGVDGVPLREKQLPMSTSMNDYDNRLEIREFLSAVCGEIGRPETASSWETKLLAQDIRTVAELKSLHQEDWNRLGLSIFAYRILKNVIFRRGKISLS